LRRVCSRNRLLFVGRRLRLVVVFDAEGEAEDRQRELCVVRREPLGALADEAALQLLIGLLQQGRELLVLVALARDLLELRDDRVALGGGERVEQWERGAR